MLLAESSVPVPCGRITGSGQIRLNRGYQETCCLLLVFDTKGTLRAQGHNYTVPPYAYLFLPFEETFFPLQCTMPLRWVQLYIHPEKLCTAGFRTGEVCTLAQPLLFSELWELLLSCAEKETELNIRTQWCTANLLLCLLQKDASVSADKAAQIPHYDRLATLRREIYQNPARSWNIEDICEDLCISRPYFHKIYLSAFGISCTQDVIESRIACSKELLERTEDAVAEISQRCGFESDVYFMRQFKRHTGMTPTAYRRICRQERSAVMRDDNNM